jgi:hypothetical protein
MKLQLRQSFVCAIRLVNSPAIEKKNLNRSAINAAHSSSLSVEFLIGDVLNGVSNIQKFHSQKALREL